MVTVALSCSPCRFCLAETGPGTRVCLLRAEDSSQTVTGPVWTPRDIRRSGARQVPDVSEYDRTELAYMSVSAAPQKGGIAHAQKWRTFPSIYVKIASY